MRVFVTDGAERPALAIARSLGRRGVDVFVGADETVSLASSSRYCRRHVTYPSPYRDRRLFHRFLADLVQRYRIDVLIPVTDVTTWLVTQNRDAFPHCALAVPRFEAFDFVSDKSKLLQRAATCGIPIPRTHFVAGGANMSELARQVGYPAVVKPARSRIPTPDGWTATTVRYAHSAGDLIRLYGDIEYLASHPSLIQERIAGPGMGVFVLCDHGQVRASFAHRRLRERPPSGGVGVLCESVALDHRLRDHAVRLLGPLGWHGPAMLEYKQDRRTGEPVLMEVNGRFWGSLQLAIDAGVDFPYLTYQLALGRAPDDEPSYKVGVRSRWLLGDLDQLYLRICRSGRDLPHGAPSRSQAVIGFLTGFSPTVKSQVFQAGDPGPALREVVQYARELGASAMRRLRMRFGASSSRLLAGGPRGVSEQVLIDDRGHRRHRA